MDSRILDLAGVIIFDVLAKAEVHIWHVNCHHYHLISVNLVLAAHVKKLEYVPVQFIIVRAAQNVKGLDEVVEVDEVLVLLWIIDR